MTHPYDPNSPYDDPEEDPVARNPRVSAVKMARTSVIYAILIVILALLGGWVIEWVFQSGVLGDPR